MSEIDIYNSIALKIRKLEKEKKKAKMTEEELRKSLEFVCEERIKLQEQVKELEERIEKAINKVQYIIDIGFDYDGYNDVDNLKILVDELVDLARQTKNILNGDKNE